MTHTYLKSGDPETPARYRPARRTLHQVELAPSQECMPKGSARDGTALCMPPTSVCPSGRANASYARARHTGVVTCSRSDRSQPWDPPPHTAHEPQGRHGSNDLLGRISHPGATHERATLHLQHVHMHMQHVSAPDGHPCDRSRRPEQAHHFKPRAAKTAPISALSPHELRKSPRELPRKLPRNLQQSPAISSNLLAPTTSSLRVERLFTRPSSAIPPPVEG